MLDSYDQTPVPRRRRARAELPDDYYLAHFTEMLAFIDRHYGSILNATSREFLQTFADLPLAERQLYVRLANRKGRVFRRERLRYPEIDGLPAAVDGLKARRWLVAPGREHLADILTLARRDEILAWLRQHVTGAGRTLRKAECVALVRAHDNADLFVDSFRDSGLLVRAHVDTVNYLVFLYFGEARTGLGAFTLRDLGLLSARRDDAGFEPRFCDTDTAEAAFFYAARLAGGKTAFLSSHPDTWPAAPGAEAARLCDQLALKAGRQAERAGDAATALAAYQRGSSGDCVRGAARVFIATDQRDAAKAYLQAAVDNPASDDSQLVASDLLARKFGQKRTSALTDQLRDGMIIDADQTLLGSPERAAVAHFERAGARAFRVENRLWRTLFGLIFWDELFAAATHSPFDARPAVLRDNAFAERHADVVAARLALCRDRSALSAHLLKTATRWFGTANGVFRWRDDALEVLLSLIKNAPDGAIASVIGAIAADYNGHRHGFPDLMIVDAKGLRFVEVKAEGDQLRRNQLLRLTLLRDAGFRADVARIRWTVDPAQTFVVVDVETTGGRGEQHRVTELGAVRVRGGKIIARYQTLLHPQRAIPSRISRLTGITEAMVADAPCFADVADEFFEFLGDAIFVAHNVAFDYRFIRAEFARLGRRYRAPKLCTCAGMRRFYPGQSSYSLRALCDAFQIPLRQHHRALCDAEAAAELLLLINDRRSEQLAEDS